MKMRYYFIDTSALVKRYHQEKGTEKIDEIFESKEKIIFISNLAVSEFTSAINRKKFEGEITESDLNLVLSRFFTDVMEILTIVGVTDSHVISSSDLILEYNLKALDSLQLATAVRLKELDAIFISADEKLCEAARKEGLNVVNPEK